MRVWNFQFETDDAKREVFKKNGCVAAVKCADIKELIIHN